MLGGNASLVSLDEQFIEYSHRFTCRPGTSGCAGKVNTEVISCAELCDTNNASRPDKINLILNTFFKKGRM